MFFFLYIIIMMVTNLRNNDLIKGTYLFKKKK